jgi:hypothetical protein
MKFENMPAYSPKKNPTKPRRRMPSSDDEESILSGYGSPADSDDKPKKAPAAKKKVEGKKKEPISKKTIPLDFAVSQVAKAISVVESGSQSKILNSLFLFQ